MVSRYDVIIIGLGAMGTAACHHLARRNARILGLDQFDIPHGRGSSHDHSRMIRLAYHEHPNYVPLLRRAYELWHELERASGQTLLHLTGGLYMGPPRGELVSGALSAAREHHLPHELLSRSQLAERFSQFTVPDDFVGVLEPNAGFLLPERVISAHAELAMRAGAELHGREEVIDWEADATGGTVRTRRGTYRADHLLFCGGAWSAQLLRDLGVELVVTRQALGWVWPKQPELFELGRFPVWAIGQPDGSLHYGFPMMGPSGDNPGLKIAHHARGAMADPRTVSREPMAGDEESFRWVLERYLPAADGPLLSLRTCLYTNSPDGHFIIDRHPKHANVTLACGFSGHGFKFASVMGEVLADLSLQGRTQWPVEFLRLDRFKYVG